MSEMPKTHDVRLDVREHGVVHVVLNRPEKRNALSEHLEREYSELMDWASAEESVRSIIVRGEGKHFSAGHEIGTAEGGNSPWGLPMTVNIENQKRRQRYRLAAWYCTKPVVGLAKGYVMGAANDILMACDMTVVAESAVLGHPPLRNLGAGPQGAMWTQLMGPQWTKRLLLTGDCVSARDARRIGMVTEVLPDDEVDAHAEWLARRLAAVDPTCSTLNKMYVNRAYEAMALREIQLMACDYNAMGHQAVTRGNEFTQRVSEVGFAKALEEREAIFGDYKAGKGRSPTPVWRE